MVLNNSFFMIEEVLKKIAYNYYPKGICAINDKDNYLKSYQYRNLSQTLEDFTINDIHQNSYSTLLNEFKKHNLINEIEDVSLSSWQDRCLSFELDIVDGNELIKICLNISLIIPYYVVYLLKNEITTNPYKWITIPTRNKEAELTEYREIIEVIKSIVEETIRFNKFPEDIAKNIIPDINFNDINLGAFNYYNAFFLDENKL